MNKNTPMSPKKHQADASTASTHISRSDAKAMLKNEYSPAKLEQQLKNCCSEHAKCSDDLKELAQGIEELYRLQPSKIADGVAGMERGLIEKCNQIKESRALISQLLSQTAGQDMKDSQTQIEIISRNAETQMDTGKKSNFGQQADTAPKEIIKEVEKIVT